MGLLQWHAMASLRRSIQRLGVRRQRGILHPNRALLATQFLLGEGRVAAVAAMVLLPLGAICIDLIVASYREAPMVLGVLDLVGIGTVGAITTTLSRRRGLRALASAREPALGEAVQGRLAAALTRELAVADKPRAEVESLEVSASRAFWLESNSADRCLLLDCDHDGWVLLQSPQFRTASTEVQQRWTIERLRWTHAILSLNGYGGPLAATPLQIPAAALDSLAQCEVRSRSELPLDVQGALPTAAAAYRR